MVEHMGFLGKPTMTSQGNYSKIQQFYIHDGSVVQSESQQAKMASFSEHVVLWGMWLWYQMWNTQMCCRLNGNFWASTRLRMDLIWFDLLIFSMVVHSNFTCPAYVLSSNVWEPVSFMVSGFVIIPFMANGLMSDSTKSHYLNQCWLRFTAQYAITTPQWVLANTTFYIQLMKRSISFYQFKCLIYGKHSKSSFFNYQDIKTWQPGGSLFPFWQQCL